MSGTPGSGKSTLAKRIIQHVHAVVIDHDVSKTALLRTLPIDNFSDGEIGKMAYDVDWSLVEYHLSLGQNVILDSPCLYDEMLDKGIAISTKYGATYRYIECRHEDYEEINARLRNRVRRPSQINQVSYENWSKMNEHCKRPKNHTYLQINTMDNREIPIERIVSYLMRTYE
ncbi:ATP-binding protein [Exiguobacterium aestuarii]|uniref:ATP-binding protein n=1 Tax=Exiguobacterium aestuarii TaxID=273527 RepID=A0ABW2PQL4_9BACL|nr:MULTISPECIES: ATP-binding protein [Exiguobacterium]MCT4784966.1 ATP-binding protein [Exiguobacterium aestuarii]